MAPKFPVEVDVFAVPHSRMKDLVGIYKDQLSSADFCSNGALETLLPNLEKTFCEFKTHENIENQFIMERLKQRLKMLNISSQAVCNCHGDNRLAGILKLLQDGYTCTNKPISDRMNFGLELQKAVSEFTDKFIPHMEEEEEVFQPLLMKYFEYEELKSLKEQVIQQHEIWKQKLMAQKENAESMLAMLSTFATEVVDLCSSDEEEDLQEAIQTLVDLTYDSIAKKKKKQTTSAGFNHLPQEMISHMFSYFNPLERTRCAQVCKLWNVVAYSPQLWKNIYPTNWAKGFNDFQYRDPYSLVETEWTKSTCDEDYDDSETAPSPLAEREIIFYEQFVRNCLPRIGDGVLRLVVAGGLHLSSHILRSMLILCPNVQHLDASYTLITDVSFKGLSRFEACSRLEYLDLSGCRFVTDVGLERLGACFKSETSPAPITTSKCGSCCKSCIQCPPEQITESDSHGCDFSPGLSYLNLSGCTSVSDFGLKTLLDVTLQTDSLTFMDLSGCSKISGAMLNSIANFSSQLLPQDLYYCNMIQEGPYPNEANGCQNLECPLRGCCCFDQ